MKCKKCSREIPDSSTVCPYCRTSQIELSVNFGDLNNSYNMDNSISIKSIVKEVKPVNYKLIGIVSGVVLLIIIIVGIVFRLTVHIPDNSSYFKTTFEKVTNDFYDNILNSTNKGEYDLIYQKNDNSKKELSGNYQIDIKNKLISLETTIENNFDSTESIIIDYKKFQFNLYLNGVDLYLELPGITEDIIYLPITDDTGLLKTNRYDITVLYEGLVDAIDSSLDELTYKNSKDTINYLGDEINVYKVQLVLNNENKLNFYQTFYETLIDDSNFINEYARITEKTEEEIENTFNNYLDNAKNRYSGYKNESNDTLSMYVKGNKIYQIVYENDDNKFELVIGNNYTLKMYENNEIKYELIYSSESKEKEEGYITYEYNVEFIDKNKDTYYVTLKINNITDGKISKRKYTTYKSIRDYSEEEWNNIVSATGDFIKDTSLLSVLPEKFKNRCTSDLVCNCDVNKCNCNYNNKIISCNLNEIQQ